MCETLLSINKWTTPVSGIPEQSVGNFHIKKRIFPIGHTLEVGAINIQEALFTHDVTFTVLREGDKEANDTESVWMSDTPMEYYKAWELVARTIGPDVLVGGLGLGLLAHLLALRSDIQNITIIEKSPEIIKMVSPFLPAKCTVIQDDFSHQIYKMSAAEKHFDTIIVDLWKTGCNDEDAQLFSDCQLLLEDEFMNSQHLFWAFQEEADNDKSKNELYFLKTAGKLVLPELQ